MKRMEAVGADHPAEIAAGERVDHGGGLPELGRQPAALVRAVRTLEDQAFLDGCELRAIRDEG